MAQAGWSIVIAEIDDAKGRSAEQEMRGNGWNVFFARCDVREEQSVGSSVEAAIERFGRIDCLVNNAGVHPAEGHLDKVAASDFDQLLRMNLTSAYLVSQSAIPYLRKSKGSVVNIASIAGVLGQGGAVPYSASKAGLIGLTKAMAIDLASDGVRVNAICPAGVDTPMMHEWAAGLDDYEGVIAHQHSMHRLGRMADKSEIGAVCLFLASDAASFITGQALIVDGGVSIGY
jgi:NAD(P)-dependent dehydrogenase (short-subunit alcohol dehydrogenase family)